MKTADVLELWVSWVFVAPPTAERTVYEVELPTEFTVALPIPNTVELDSNPSAAVPTIKIAVALPTRVTLAL